MLNTAWAWLQQHSEAVCMLRHVPRLTYVHVTVALHMQLQFVPAVLQRTLRPIKELCIATPSFTLPSATVADLIVCLAYEQKCVTVNHIQARQINVVLN